MIGSMPTIDPEAAPKVGYSQDHQLQVGQVLTSGDAARGSW
jgi:hypothetical protein